MSKDTHYIIARVVRDGAAVELKHISSNGPPHIVAQVAAQEGYDLLYELDAEPDMALAQRLAASNKLATMSSVVRLFDLRAAKPS